MDVDRLRAMNCVICLANLKKIQTGKLGKLGKPETVKAHQAVTKAGMVAPSGERQSVHRMRFTDKICADVHKLCSDSGNIYYHTLIQEKHPGGARRHGCPPPVR